METKHFLTSIVFPEGAKKVSPVVYTEPIVCDEHVKVFPHKLGGNSILIKDCNFTVYPSHNEWVMNQNRLNGADRQKHIVADSDQKYTVIAYIGVENGNELTNSIRIVTTLPKGLTMNLLAACETEVFIFSGLNLMLFDNALNCEMN